MATTALVTGGGDRVGAVARALRAAGLSVVEARDEVAVGDALVAAGKPTLDAYVQLPVEVRVSARSITAQLGALLEQGIVSRFRTADTVLEHLSSDAHVVLVPGNLPPDLSTPDDHEARLALLRALAHALRVDRASHSLSVTVASVDHSPQDLARLAVGAHVPHPAPPDYASMWPEMTYDEWRLAVLGLETLEG